jgi:hypothetical protein
LVGEAQAEPAAFAAPGAAALPGVGMASSDRQVSPRPLLIAVGVGEFVWLLVLACIVFWLLS